MKKRKSCTLSQTRSIRDIQSLSRLHSYDSTSKLSVKNLSQRTSSPRNNKRRAFTKSTSSRPSSGLIVSRKEAYKSLESLFDITKTFHIAVEDFPFYYPPAEERLLYSDTEADVEDEVEDDELGSQFGKLEDFIEKLKPVFSELESPTDLQNDNVDESLNEEVDLILQSPKEFDITPVASETEEETQDAELKMTEEKSITEEAMEEATEEATEEAAEDAADDTQSSAAKSVTKSVAAKSVAKSKQDCESVRAPDYPIPPGLGEGIVVSPDKHCDSVMSAIPITESCVIDEMIKAEERANFIRREIQCLKKIIDDLSCKEELSEEDTNTLKDTQTQVMCKVDELNEITRKLQRTIGLIDPSSRTFAKMFEMLPYPHKGVCRPDEESCTQLADACLKACEKFAFPQIDLPEDKLPRVIICGNTEENFPKIVVADSRPKSRGNKCIENLTGKLSESLCLQEKLVKENAELEGGKFQLERELLEKDNAVECLQRKICGLQAEMRMIVKENSELSRRVTHLARQKEQSACCSPPPTSCSSPRQTTGSPCGSPKKIDLSCKCGSKGQSYLPPAEPKRSPCRPDPCRPDPCRQDPCRPDPCKPDPCRDPCAKPKDPCPKSPCPKDNPCKKASKPPCNDPCKDRLGGGASRGFDDNHLKNCENNMYHRIGGGGSCQKSPPNTQRGGGVCPAEIEDRIAAYGNNTKLLGDQLSCIEAEVRTLQTELMNVQRERQQLEQQRKLMECAGPSNACSCCPEPPKPPKGQNMTGCSACNNDDSIDAACAVQQLRDLREQYARLQEDYKSKLCEVSRLRTDADCLKRDARESKEERERMEIKLVDVQERLRAVEADRDELLGTKEQLVEQEQALLVARQRFREAQDELEELRSMIRDQAMQLDDYRTKYLMAQQQVEEQKRQLDLMEMDNARMNENVTLEIGRVKNQFQEKLAELAPLPDILKQTQLKLQECQQLRMLAEHNCEDLSRELLSAKDKIDQMQTQINDLQREIQALQDEKNDGGGRIDELEKKNGELRNENERLKNACNRYEEQQCQMQKRIDEKQHEICQLTAMLEQVREDSARQVARTKERCEAIKRSMQAQISDFEVQLAQCRAAAKTAQKERDEIRQKMQGQIGNLNEALQQAQGRIRSLQGHVDYLKVSYSNVFGSQGQGESPSCAQQPETSPGYDSCDCNY